MPWLLSAVAGLSCLAVLQSVSADPGPTGKATDDGAQPKNARLESMKRSVARYALFPGGQRKTPMQRSAEPVLRWTNPERGAKDGCLFLWTHAGLPAAIVCFYPTPGEDEGFWDHEFQSLSREKIVAERNQKPVWTPRMPGLEFKPVPDAPVPAETPVLRLAQIRKLADRFSATNNYHGNKSPVRLLARPIHRYGDKSSDVLDGAVLVFVQGTDPEVLLLIEARVGGDSHQWHYGLARMTSLGLEVDFDRERVWTADRWNGQPDPEQPYITFSRQPPD